MGRCRSALILAIFVLAVFSCTKEEAKTRYSRQEQNIESFVNSILSSVDTAYVVHNAGSSRVVVVPGDGDSLSTDGTVSFYYAGYVLKNSRLSSSDLFATNDKDIATAAGWTLSDDSAFEIKTLNVGADGLVTGLRHGLEGVKAGQECYILFSGKYGFGKHQSGTIPANAALAYHIKVESISNE